MDSYAEYGKQIEEARAIRQQKARKTATVISITSTVIGIFLLVIGVAGYLANTELVIEPDDLYGAVGLIGGCILTVGNVLAGCVYYT